MYEGLDGTGQRWPRLAAALALTGLTLFAVSMVLIRSRAWSCEYRYWSDGGRDLRPSLAFGLTVVGMVLGAAGTLVAAFRHGGAQPRTWRTWLVVVGGLVPVLAYAVFIISEVNGNGHHWMYDCSTG